MKYKLKKATNNDIEYLIKYKLTTIFDYATNLSEEEKNKIIIYVNHHVRSDVNNYKLILINNKIVGCLLYITYEDGLMLDEIYLEENYRGQGIGTSILKTILLDNKNIYLWVYKENVKAIKLYNNLGFKVIEDTENRYFMKK